MLLIVEIHLLFAASHVLNVKSALMPPPLTLMAEFRAGFDVYAPLTLPVAHIVGFAPVDGAKRIWYPSF